MQGDDNHWRAHDLVLHWGNKFKKGEGGRVKISIGG